MKLRFDSNWGRFNYSLTTSVPDGTDASVINLVANEGLANLGFRACGSNVEKAFVDAKVMDKDDKRNTVEYSDENAETFRAASQAKLDELSKSESYPAVSIAVTGEHVFGETEVSRKMAVELLAQADDAVKLALGIKPTTGDADAIEIAHAFLAKLRKAPKRKKA